MSGNIFITRVNSAWHHVLQQFMTNVEWDLLSVTREVLTWQHDFLEPIDVYDQPVTIIIKLLINVI